MLPTNELDITTRFQQLELEKERSLIGKLFPNNNSQSQPNLRPFKRDFRITDSHKKPLFLDKNSSKNYGTNTPSPNKSIAPVFLHSYSSKSLQVASSSTDEHDSNLLAKYTPTRSSYKRATFGSRSFSDNKPETKNVISIVDKTQHKQSNVSSFAPICPSDSLDHELINRNKHKLVNITPSQAQIKPLASHLSENRRTISHEKNLSIPTFDSFNTEIYRQNRKKYMPLTKPTFTPVSSNNAQESQSEEFNLQRLKEELKLTKRIRMTSMDAGIGLQRLRNVQALHVELQKSNIAPEDELRISILKRKIAIGSLFQNEKKENASVDEKKVLFRQLLLEYHPDKTNHPKELSDEIFNFLQQNKEAFMNGVV